MTKESTPDVDLKSISGIGSKTATQLRDQFGDDRDALCAGYSIPGWIKTNIDGMGPVNTTALQAAAGEIIDEESDDSFRVLDPIQQKIRALHDNQFKIYDKYYYPVGFTAGNIALYYSGYYQGGSYKVQISRQVFSRDKVNSVTAAWWHPLDNEWRLFQEHTWEITSPFRCPISWSSSAEYLADIVDEFQWKYLTEYGLIWYQRSRNYLEEHYPESLNNETVHTDGYHDSREIRVSADLIGVTLDRIAIYWDSTGRRSTVRRIVKTPDGDFYQLSGETNIFQTNDSSFYDSYESKKGLAIDLANTTRKGAVNTRKGREEGGLWKYNRDGGVQCRILEEAT